jgi:hypothetical protein
VLVIACSTQHTRDSQFRGRLFDSRTRRNERDVRVAADQPASPNVGNWPLSCRLDFPELNWTLEELVRPRSALAKLGQFA